MNKLHKNNPPRFIKNDVCGEDLFEGKSHEDTAKAIKNIITSKDSCSIIGIDGGWGSGKSNLVKLVENEIYSDKDLIKDNYRFFTYDAWGHQEDLQRRSILEELIDDLIVEKRISTTNDCKRQEVVVLPAVLEDRWTIKLEKLLAKRRKNTTETVPKIGVGIIISALVLILTPIASIIAEWISESCVSGRMIVTSLPIITGFIYLYFTAKKNIKKREESITMQGALAEMFLLYKDEVKTTTAYENISEKEPTSREFKKWMIEIDKDLDDRALVVIFDNMDRLPKAKVQELWATIHTFFADASFKNIKVIVPFDRMHIISAFKAENTDNLLKTGKDTEPKQSLSICYGDDYINKTFDIIFRVAPPTMSNWRDYFATKWQVVFGEHEIVDSRTLQIFDANTTLLTPRKINAFINEIASIKQMGYASDIPCEYIALFVFGKTDICNNPNVEILNPTYINSSVKYLYDKDDNMPQFISALYYQLTPEKAMDIVSTDALRKALDAGDAEYVNRIKESTIFNHILDNAIPKINAISNAVTVLSENEKCTPINWYSIFKVLQEKRTTDFIHQELQDYQVSLLLKLNGEEQAEYLQQIICDFYTDNTINDAVKFSGEIIKLSEALSNDDPYKHLRNSIIEPAAFVNFVKSTKDNWGKFKVSCQQDLLDKHFNTFSIESVSYFDIYKYIKNDFDMSIYIERLKNLIDEHVSDAGSIQLLYDRLKEINTPIDKILSDEELYTLRTNLTKNDSFYYDIICMHLSKFTTSTGTYTSVFADDMENDDHNFVIEVAKRIESYVNYGKLLLQLSDSSSVLYKSVVQNVTENTYGGSSMNIEKVLITYDNIIRTLNITPQILINRFNGWTRWAKEEIDIGNVKTIPILFFQDVKSNNINNELTSHCEDVAIQYINILSKENWIKAISTGDYNFQLLIILSTRLPQTCFDALNELLKGYATGDIKTFNENNAQTILKLAERDGRGMTALFKSIRNSFIDNSRMTPDLFAFYGDRLLKYGKLNEHKDALCAIFTSTIIDDDRCLGIMTSNLKDMVDIVNCAGDDSIEFKAKIQDKLDNGIYNVDIGFETFANEIRVYKKESPKEDVGE